MTLRSDSASSRSPRAVEPATSEKTTVTVFRTSRPVGVRAASGAAQARQNRAISGFSWPQVLQTAMLRVYADGRVSTSSVQRPLELRDPQTRQNLAVAQLGEAFAPVELLCRLVRSSGLRDRSARLGLRPERGSQQGDADSSPEEVREHGEPVEIDRSAVESP